MKGLKNMFMTFISCLFHEEIDILPYMDYFILPSSGNIKFFSVLGKIQALKNVDNPCNFRDMIQNEKNHHEEYNCI